MRDRLVRSRWQRSIRFYSEPVDSAEPYSVIPRTVLGRLLLHPNVLSERFSGPVLARFLCLDQVCQFLFFGYNNARK